MEIFKTMVFLGDHSTPQYIETIYHGKYWWLVATWLFHQATGKRIPERIIRMDGLTICFQEVNDPNFLFLVNNSIPISLFDGIPQSGYVITTHPSAMSHSHKTKTIH